MNWFRRGIGFGEGRVWEQGGPPARRRRWLGWHRAEGRDGVVCFVLLFLGLRRRTLCVICVCVSRRFSIKDVSPPSLSVCMYSDAGVETSTTQRLRCGRWNNDRESSMAGGSTRGRQAPREYAVAFRGPCRIRIDPTAFISSCPLAYMVGLLRAK